MTIHDCINAFSNIKAFYIRPLSECSRNKKGEVICNDAFSAYNLELLNTNWIKIPCSVADALWFDEKLGIVIVEFKNGNLDNDEKRRLRLQSLESSFILLPAIMNKCGQCVAIKDICDVKKTFIVVYNIDHYSELKSSKIARHLRALSLFNIKHLEGTVYDNVLPYDRDELMKQISMFKEQKASPK